MIMLKLQMITVEVIQMVVKANHDISSGLDTAFINSAINSNLAYDKEAKEFYFLGEIFANGFPTPIKMEKTKDDAFEINYTLDVPVRDDIYEYMTS